MAKVMQGTLATIKEASRRPIWEEPNLQYDGTEPPKGWLDRLKQLRQIHGYNDKEIVHIAERCMKGSAQLWFRIHHPKSFETLRTGLHTRFASGPVLVAATAPPPASAGQLGSISPKKSYLRKLVPSGVQWDIAMKSSPQNGLEVVAKPNILLHDDAHRYFLPSDITSKTTQKSQGSQLVRSNSSTGPAQGKSEVAPVNFSRGPVRGGSRRYCTSAVDSNAGRPVDVNPNSASGKGPQDSKVFRAKCLRSAKNKMEIHTRASSSHNGEGDELKDKGDKSLDTTSISLSSMSCRILARDVLQEDGTKDLPAGCRTLPINWQEALLKFKHAIHLAMRGDWTQMSSDFCKYYLRCYRMRTSGSKRELVHRIRDHLELTDGSGAHKYPRSSFVIDCAGVVCLGDVILFEQKLRTGFDVLNGNQFDNSIRTVVGRVVKDFNSASSHQQVFTVEVYWSKGQEAFRPMRPLYITAKDLFSMRPLRQRWINEEARKGLLDDKKKFTLEKKARHGLKVAPPGYSRLSV